MPPLTEKQQQILDIIRRQIIECGHAPTVREIGAMVNLSSSCTVAKHLDNLESKGYIRRDRYNRFIELTDGTQPLAARNNSVSVPLLGRVAGGPAILAQEYASPEMLPIPISLLSRGDQNGEDLFALEVCGNSMRDAGIADGDIIVARRQSTARNGEMVVALIDDEATVKTFYKEADRVRLQPENPDFEPIYAKEGLQILGRVTMAIKRF